LTNIQKMSRLVGEI